MMKSIIVKLSLAAFALASSSAFACIPVTQVDLPLTINQSGSYCVSEDLQSSGIRTTAITILADNVTLDLKGHILKGGMQGVLSRNDGVIIKNGTIANARNGVTILGSLSDKAKSNTIENVSFTNITGTIITMVHAKGTAVLNNGMNLDLENANSNNSGTVINARRSASLHIKNNTISINNWRRNTPATVFVSTQSSNIIIENNAIFGEGPINPNALRLFMFSNSRSMVIKNNNSSGIYDLASMWANSATVLIDNTIIGSSLNAFPTNLNLIDGGGNQFF